MEFLKFDINKCVLCGVCVEKCPFGALTIEGNGIVVGDACRMCGLCVRNCPEKAIRFEQKAKSFDKDKWKNFLIYVEQERGEIHPVTFELIGEARKMAVKVGYQVNCVIVGGKGTKENAAGVSLYLSSFLSKNGIEESRANRIAVAVEEMAANCAERMEGKKKFADIDIRIFADKNETIISVRDNGDEFDPLNDDKEFEMSPLTVVKAISDKVEYSRVLGFNRTIIKL